MTSSPQLKVWPGGDLDDKKRGNEKKEVREREQALGVYPGGCLGPGWGRRGGV